MPISAHKAEEEDLQGLGFDFMSAGHKRQLHSFKNSCTGYSFASVLPSTLGSLMVCLCVELEEY